MTIRAFLLAGAASLMATSPGAARADTLRYASGWPSGASVSPVFETFAETVGEKTGGELAVKIYPLSLLNFLEANEGVKDGITDMATVLPAYHAAEFPNLNLIAEFSPVTALPGTRRTCLRWPARGR